MDLGLLPLSVLATGIELGPATPATIPAHVPINFPCPVGPDGWATEPVAQFGNCVTPAETKIWGSIKSLYR